MNLRILSLTMALAMQCHGQSTELMLAPGQWPDLFGGRKHEIAVSLYTADKERREFPAQLFQVAGKLAVPVALTDGKPLVIEGGNAIKRSGSWSVVFPRVERKTPFVARFEGAGVLRFTIYPENLLDPLRSVPDTGPKLYTLTSAGELATFLRDANIPSRDLGATVPPEFAEAAVMLAQSQASAPQDLPRTLHKGQALVIFQSPEDNDLPRIVASPLGRGFLITVKLKLLDRLPVSPRAQEIFAEIIDFARTQIQPTPAIHHP
jgi:hypothetical protein